MKNLFRITFSLFSFLLLVSFTNIASAVFQNPGNGIIMYDNAEQVPEVSWGMDRTKGYAMVTGGNQSTSNVDSRTGFRVSGNYARAGSKSYELFVTKRTDYPGCCQWVRSEVMWMDPGQQTMANEWRWAAVSTLIDPSFQFESRRTQIAFDHKESPDDQQTPFWLGIQNDRYIIDGRFVGGAVDMGKVDKGVWIDWLLERNWSTGSDGFMRFYKNGTLVWEKYGPNRDGRSGSAPITRIQHGLYKWVWATANGQNEGGGVEPQASAPMKMYIDEIRFGGPSATKNQFLLSGSGTVSQPASQPAVSQPAVSQPATSQSATTSTNVPPTVYAGDNQTITLPTSTVTLNGTASDSDGSVSKYSWAKTVGGSATIASPLKAATSVTGLSAGSYTFVLTVTDNGGLTSTDYVMVTVNSSGTTTTAPISTKFKTGDRVEVNATNLNIRATASPSGTLLGTQSKPSIGTIVGGPVSSGGYVWWNVNYDNGVDGWGSEEFLIKNVTATTPLPTTPTPIPSTPTTTTTNTGTWTFCAAEGGTCTFSGTKEVRYGYGANWAYKTVNSPVSCNNATFGDPFHLTMKGCYYSGASSTASARPTTYAGDNQVITLPTNSVTLTGTAADTDGTISKYAWTKELGGGAKIVSPNSATTNVTGLTAGEYRFILTVTDNTGLTGTDFVLVTVNSSVGTSTPNTTNTGTWTFCAVEGGTCNFSGSKEVRYGYGDKWAYKNATGSVSCNNATFGDPFQLTMKGCYYSGPSSTPTTSTPTTSTPTTSTPVSTVNKFNIGDRVEVNATSLNVRSTASTTGSLLGSQPKKALGTIYSGPTNATGYKWWNVNYDSGVDGWSAEDYLIKYVAPATSSPATTTPTTSTPATTSGWTQCATEGGSCTFSGTRQVRYGVDPNWMTKTLNSPVLCSNATFPSVWYNPSSVCQYSGTATNIVAEPVVVTPTTPTNTTSSATTKSTSTAGMIFSDNAEQVPQVSWGMDFTKGYSMVTGGNQSTSNVDSRTGFRVSSNYARSGNKSYEVFVTKRTDYPACCEWTRSEVMWMAPSQQTMANEWRFAAISILVDPSWQFESRRAMIGYDHKESPDDMQTPFGLLIQNDRYQISGRFVDGVVDLGKVEKGVWVDWLLERNWSTGSDGYMRMYKNGVKVWERFGPNRDGRSGSAPITRIQHGLYKWVWASANGQGEGAGTEPQASAPIKVYMDEIRFGGPGATLNQFLFN